MNGFGLEVVRNLWDVVMIDYRLPVLFFLLPAGNALAVILLLYQYKCDNE